MRIVDFRLSCIWSEGIGEAFGPVARGRVDALMRPDGYASLFNAILEANNDPLLTTPWPSPGPRGALPLGNSYWRKYILAKVHGSPPAERGREAFRVLVPFKRNAPLVRLKCHDRCFVEAWFHPHGTTLIATAWLRAGYDAAALEAAAYGFMHGKHKATWADGMEEEENLERIASGAFERLRTEGFGGVDPGFRSEPLRVLTVVSLQQAAGEDAAAGLSAIIESAASAVGGEKVLNPSETHSDILMLTKGRVICNEAKATTLYGRPHTLGCLHRNVTAASAQVASLLSGAEAALAALAQANNVMHPRVENYVRQLAQQLETVHSGKGTYAQPCVQTQARGATDLINRLRANVPLPPLA